MNIVFYHAECIDGFTAAWVFHRLGGVTCIPLKYGEWEKTTKEMSFAPEDHIIFVDVSIEPEDVAKLANLVAHVTILDHHKTAWEKYANANLRADRVTVRFDMSRSGAALAWQHQHGGLPPMLVRYVEDHDLWRHELPDSKNVHAFVASLPYDFEAYESVNELFRTTEGRSKIVAAGESILRRQAKTRSELLKKAMDFELLGVNVKAVNYGAREGISDLGHELAKLSPDGCGLVYSIEPDFVQVSLRGHDGRDVSKIASHFGGGGHPGAAGFRVPIERFLTEFNPTVRRFLLD